MRDWKRLDPIVCTKVKRFRFSASLAGHIDFSTPCNSDLLPVRKERKAREQADVGQAKRPMALQQPGSADKPIVNQVLDIIKRVRLTWPTFFRSILGALHVNLCKMMAVHFSTGLPGWRTTSDSILCAHHRPELDDAHVQ